MIVSKVSLERVNQALAKLAVHLPKVFAKSFGCFVTLLIGAQLRRRQRADDCSQADEAFRDSVRLRGPSVDVGVDPRKSCLELRVLIQQELHQSFALLRRHRLEIHGNTLASRLLRHYAIVVGRRGASGVPIEGRARWILDHIELGHYGVERLGKQPAARMSFEGQGFFLSRD